MLIRPFYAFKQGEPYSLYLDPNRESHRDARFVGRRLAGVGGVPLQRPARRLGRVRFPRDGIRWIGFRFDDAGIAELRIDDRPVGRSTSTPPGAASPLSGARTACPTRIIASRSPSSADEARGLQGPLHQHRRIRGDAVTTASVVGPDLDQPDVNQRSHPAVTISSTQPQKSETNSIAASSSPVTDGFRPTR